MFSVSLAVLAVRQRLHSQTYEGLQRLVQQAARHSSSSSHDVRETCVMRLVQSVAVVLMVAGVGGDVPGHQWLSSGHDLLSAITWATLDLDHLNQPSILTSPDGLNVTSPRRLHQLGLNWTSSDPLNVTSSGSRKKRAISLVFPNPFFVELEVKILFPLFRIYASDNLNLEIQFLYEMLVPDKVKGLAKEEEHWEEAVSAMANDLEGLVSMLGLDGGGCVRKVLCELSAMPSISPEGLTGEMLQLLVRHLRNQDIRKVSEEESVKNNVLDDESGAEREGEKNPSEGETGAVSEWEMYRSGNETDVSGNERVESEADQMKERRKENKRKKIRKGTNNKRKGRSDNEEAAEGDVVAEKRRRWKRTKRDYAAATVHGKTHGNCRDAFPECPVSLLQLLAAAQRASPSPTPGNTTAV